MRNGGSEEGREGKSMSCDLYLWRWRWSSVESRLRVPNLRTGSAGAK